MEISEIKARLPIQTTLNHYNLLADKNNMHCCPFHLDDTASMKIYPNPNTFNCFGCNANGDVIEFIQRKENCSKHVALVKAAELCGESKPMNNQLEKSTIQPKQNHTEILPPLPHDCIVWFSRRLTKTNNGQKIGVNFYCSQ